ncbi:MAG TPA: threonine/serine dehydratase [Jiangellaceae bacterium]
MVMVGIDDVRAAAKRISGQHVRTPLLPWPAAGSEVWLKPENLQPTGAFKLRGASNAIGALTDAERSAGVVTYSSGNHGRAVAWAARRYGVPAVVVMPDSTPAVKVEGVRAIGTEVILVPAAERESRAEEILAERGGALIPPFDHPDVIAGQGTIGLEIAEDLPDVDTVLVPVSGGGLVSGIAVAIKALCPRARVIAVEPELAADLAEGFAAGRRVGWPHEWTARTIADALRVPLVAELTWEHIKRFVDDVVTVPEEAILQTTARLAMSARIVAEPGGAVAPAVALTRPDVAAGRTVAIVSGGNVEPSLLVRVLSEYVT